MDCADNSEEMARNAVNEYFIFDPNV
jgi:hypothetical protein